MTLPGDRVVDGVYQAFGDQTTDQLFALITAMLAELWTVRDRQRLLELALEQQGVAVHAAIETLRCTPEDITAMTSDRDAFVERVFGSLSTATGRWEPSAPVRD